MPSFYIPCPDHLFFSFLLIAFSEKMFKNTCVFQSVSINYSVLLCPHSTCCQVQKRSVSSVTHDTNALVKNAQVIEGEKFNWCAYSVRVKQEQESKRKLTWAWKNTLPSPSTSTPQLYLQVNLFVCFLYILYFIISSALSTVPYPTGVSSNVVDFFFYDLCIPKIRRKCAQ